MMNSLQQSILSETEVPVLGRDRFTPKPDEPPQSTTPAPKGEVDEPHESTYPVWNGELDEPIWW
jgi:hypothetical protein